MKPVSRAILILLCLVLLLSLAACASSDGIPKEAKKLFQNYLDYLKSDRIEAAKLVIFKDDAERKDFEESPPSTDTFKILKWEKINDSIWAVQWENTKPNSQGKAVVYTNWSFVLLRDEQYIIARSIASVPRVFRDTFDIEPYIPTDGTMLPNFYD